MKTKSWVSLFAALVLSSLAASESFAGVSFSVSIFNGPLQSCGYWITDPAYGRCWRPAYVANDWYPYCEGYWMWTSCGWYWVSSEPWAWATYHYGRWSYDPYYGWIWVPDTVWGPSWVCWREGGGYCGWAPLPPGAVFGPTGEIVYRNGPPPDRFFLFVDIGHFSDPINRRNVIINNTVVINRTVNITGITRVNNVVVNRGLKVDDIQRFSARKLTEAPSRAALQRSATAGPRGAAPEVIRGGTAQSVYQRQPSGQWSASPTPRPSGPSASPNQNQQHYYQNFESRNPSSYSPASPDSIQPRQRASQQPATQGQPSRDNRNTEKSGQPQSSQGQPRPDQSREESPRKGPPGNN